MTFSCPYIYFDMFDPIKCGLKYIHVERCIKVKWNVSGLEASVVRTEWKNSTSVVMAWNSIFSFALCDFSGHVYGVELENASTKMCAN